MNVNPSDAVALDEETAEGAASAAAEHAAAEGASESVGAEDMGGTGTSIKNALLHTEPHIAPSTAKHDMNVDDAGAHAYIGVRKFVAGLGVGGEDSDGTPAIIHFAAAGWHTFLGGDGEESDELQESERTDMEVVDDGGEGWSDPAEGGAA